MVEPCGQGLAVHELMDRFGAFGCTVAGNTLNAVKMPGMTFPWERDQDILFLVDDMMKNLVDYEKAAKEDYGLQGQCGKS